MTFVIQYKDGYGSLHNEEILAEDEDDAFDIAIKFLGSENVLQQIWKKS